MKFESFNSNENSESLEHKKLRVKNELQSLVMLTVCGMDNDKCMQDWVDNYADSFSVVFNEVLDRDPEFFDKWDKNIDGERNKSLDFFMEELRKLDGPSKKAA